MYMREVGICYGMTETSPVSTQTTIGTPLEKQVGTVGSVQDHLEIKNYIDPETGAIKNRNEPGELCTRGYSVMIRLLEQSRRATAEVIDEKPDWMHSAPSATMNGIGIY